MTTGRSLRAKRFFPSRAPGSSAGITYIDLMVGLAVTGIIMLVVASLTLTLSRGLTKFSAQHKSEYILRNAYDDVERDLRQMNEINVAEEAQMVFRMDSYLVPGYNANAVVNGIIRIRNPDDDGDEWVINPGQPWRVGNDLDDDDEDPLPSGDEEVDVLCRYRIEGGALLRDFNFNGAGWTNEKVLVTDIIFSTFQYLGSASQDWGKNLDGNLDGVVSPEEIDQTNFAEGGRGNEDGIIFNNQNERNYIVQVSMEIGVDMNRDGKEDFRLISEVSPALLPLKWKRWD